MDTIEESSEGELTAATSSPTSKMTTTTASGGSARVDLDDDAYAASASSLTTSSPPLVVDDYYGDYEYLSSLRTFGSCLKTVSQTGIRYIEARLAGIFAPPAADSFSRPIGLCLLPCGKLVVSSSGDDSVRMVCSRSMEEVGRAAPGRPFRRPSDLLALPDGRFAGGCEELVEST